MAALTIPHHLPPALLVVSQDMIERIDTLCLRAATFNPTTTDEVALGKAVAKELRALSAEIETERKKVTGQLDAIIATCIDLQREAQKPLDATWKDLTARIDTFVRVENEKREKARQAAAAEAARLQKIADDEAAARMLRLQQEAEENACPGEAVPEVPVTAALPVTIPQRFTPPPMSMSTRRKVEYSLEYIDGLKVPISSPQGHLLRPIDEAELKRYLKALPAGKREIVGAVKLVETEGRMA